MDALSFILTAISFISVGMIFGIDFARKKAHKIVEDANKEFKKELYSLLSRYKKLYDKYVDLNDRLSDKDS